MWWVIQLGCQQSAFEIRLDDRNNYHFQSSFSVASTEIAEGVDSRVEWRGLDEDILGNSLDATAVSQLSIIRFPSLTQESVLLGIENDSLRQSDLSGAVDLDARGREEAMLSDFSIQGTALNPQEEIYSDLGTYLLLAYQEERVVGLQFLAPTEGSQAQEISMNATSTILEYTVDFGEEILAMQASELYLDWSNLTQTGSGNPIPSQRIDRLVIAGFQQEMDELHDDFLRSRSLATELVVANVAGLQAIPFSRIEEFNGFTPGLIWLIALECSLCLNPAPFFVGEVVFE